MSEQVSATPAIAEQTPTTSDQPASALQTAASSSHISIHLPSPQALKTSTGPSITGPPPPTPWLLGTWQVTHSTLPMWKGKANVRITYNPLADSPPSGDATAATTEPQAVDDLVEYQKEGSDKVSSVHGVSRPMDVDGFSEKGWAYHWRGKGWLMIASSHWEILGHGHEQSVTGGAEGNKWVVTYFSSTLFTPAGLDVYSQDPDGLRAETLGEIKTQLQGLGNETLSKLAAEMFAIPRK